MRTRRLIPWLIFALGALAVLEGLGWVTWRSLTLERREREARAESGVQESLRLALWRMESELTPIIAQESARPYFHYLALYPAQRRYESMLDPPRQGEVLVPSPLLEPPGPYIRLHYQIAGDGRIESPQAPEGAPLVAASHPYLDPEYTMLAQQRLDALRAILSPRRANFDRDDAPGAPALGPKDAEDSSLAAASAAPAESPPQSQRLAGRIAEQSTREFEARQQAAENAYTQPQSVPNLRKSEAPASRMATPSAARRDESDSKPQARALDPLNPGSEFAPKPASLESPVKISAFVPRWISREPRAAPELVLERRVTIGATSVTQGVWIDWPALRARLLGQIGSLMPGADLVPYAGRAAPESQRLASIPALLLPDAPVAAPDGEPSATRLILGVTWLAVLASIAAIAYVLRQSLDLSERRGRFVSAVTHELRTPLTTFTLYSEMLDRGLVADETTRREYLSTLHSESRRLSGLVENVLAFARLGRRVPRRVEPPIALRDLLKRIHPALLRAAESHALLLSIEPDASAEVGSDPVLRVDPGSVERILLNLVENAGKYASEAPDRRVHLRWGAAHHREAGEVHLTIVDHGPGVPAREARAIFSPFYRARREESSAKPGLGLGLALARALARELGGDLRLDRSTGEGAAFTLILPLDPSPSHL